MKKLLIPISLLTAISTPTSFADQPTESSVGKRDCENGGKIRFSFGHVRKPAPIRRPIILPMPPVAGPGSIPNPGREPYPVSDGGSYPYPGGGPDPIGNADGYGSCGSSSSGPAGNSSNGSEVFNGSREYISYSADYRIINTLNSCSSCFAGGPSAGNMLPSINVTRMYRPRLTKSDYIGSFGKCHYWAEIDKALFISNSNIKFNAANLDQGNIGIYNPTLLAWQDIEDSSFDSIRLLDASGSSLDKNNINSAVYAVVLMHDGTTIHFDIVKSPLVSGIKTRHAATIDRYGNAIELEYDVNPDATGEVYDPQLTNTENLDNYYKAFKKNKVTDAYNRSIDITTTLRSGNNYCISKLDLPSGQSIDYTLGNITGLQGNHNLREVTHPNGLKSTWVGSKEDSFTVFAVEQKDTLANGSPRKKNIRLTTFKHFDSQGTQFSVTARNRIISVTNGESEVTSAIRFADDANGDRQRYIYKGGNHAMKITTSTNGSVTAARDITSTIDKATFYTADANTWLKRSVHDSAYTPSAYTTGYTDAFGRHTSVTLHPIYTSLPTSTTRSDGSVRTAVYGMFMNPLSMTDSLGRTNTFTYDALGSKISETRALGTADEATYTNLYNSRGQITESRDALYDANHPELHNTQYEYDANGYLVLKRDAADTIGGTRPQSTFTYDIAGRIITSTDPLGRTNTLEYDTLSRVTKVIYNDTSYESVEYGTTDDTLNLIKKSRNRNGIYTDYTYDTAGRLTKSQISNHQSQVIGEISYTYLKGTKQALTSTSNGETTTYQYDYANRLIGHTIKANANKNLTTTREYDNLSRLRSTTDAYGRKTYYLYDQNDRLIRTVTETVPNGLTNVPAFVATSSQTSAAHTYSLTDIDNNQLDTTATHLVTYTDPRDLFLKNLNRDLTGNAKYLITDSIIDSEGQRLISTDPRGTNSWTEHDQRGRTVLTIAAVGTPSEIRSEQDYDENSNLVESRSPRHFTEGTTLTGVGKDTYTYNGRNMRATHNTAVGSTEEQTQSWTYYLDGRADEHTDFRGNIAKQIWHLCCGRLQASIQRDGTSVSINNTDYNGNTTHTAVVSALPAAGTYHNPTDPETLSERTTRYDGRGRPTHTTTWLTPLGTVDDDARLSLGDATGIPIAGFGGIPATDGLTTTYIYDEDLTDGLGIDADYTTQLTELNARYGYNPFSSSGLPAGAPSSNGYAVAVTNPAGETSVQISDGAGRTILTINPEGDLATMHYDEVVSDADLWSASNTPNQGTLLATKSIDALGNENTSYTDAAGRTIASKDAENNISGAAYNANSSVTSTRDANSLGQDCDYDALNRPTTCADLQETAEGNDRTTTYNAASQTLTSTNADNETTTNIYDVRGRLSTTTDPNNITTSYLYDANNNLITLEDGNNNQRHWFFDDRNLNTTKVYPGNAGNDFYTQNFDALGRVSIKVDQIGTTTTMIYDLAGRLTDKQYHTGATPAQGGTVTQGGTLESTDTFTYDAASRILTTHKGRHNITTEHTYAVDSQPLTETLAADGRTYTTTRSYDEANRPLTHTYPSGETTHWAYTDRNLVSTVHYEDKLVVTNTHDAGYRLTQETYGNGLTRTINYNRSDNLRTSDNVAGEDDLALSYTYAADKQITAENIIGDLIQNTSMTANYDDGNRITSWTRPNAPVNNAQTWNYDDAGNWNTTTKTNGNATTTEARNHSTADQITSIAGNAATHDAKGNLTEYEINGKDYAVEYDLDNRIIKADITNLNNNDVEYRYDALGRRVIRKRGIYKRALIWWGNSECAEYKHRAGQACIQNDIFSHPSRLNAVIARAYQGSKLKLQWYHKNYLDHVYAVSDDDSDIIEHYRYTAFGEVTIYGTNGNLRTGTAIDNDIMWNTRRRDRHVGYYLYKYRHYSPELGRWPSRDPIEEWGGVNLYAFAYNDGINLWDYLGLELFPGMNALDNPPQGQIDTRTGMISSPNGGSYCTRRGCYTTPHQGVNGHDFLEELDDFLEDLADVVEDTDFEAGLGMNASAGAAAIVGGEIQTVVTLTTKCRICVTASVTISPLGISLGAYAGTGFSAAADWNNSYEGSNLQNSGTFFGGLGLGGSASAAFNDHSFAIDASAGGYVGGGILSGITYSSTGCASLLRHGFNMGAATLEATGKAIEGLGDYEAAYNDMW